MLVKASQKALSCGQLAAGLAGCSQVVIHASWQCESPQLPSALSLQPGGLYKHPSALGTKMMVHFALRAGLFKIFKPGPNPHVISVPELPLCFSNGDKYSHCTAAKKGGGLGQGNKACTAQGFDRTLLELGGKNVKPTAECSKTKQSCCCRCCRSVRY